MPRPKRRGNRRHATEPPPKLVEKLTAELEMLRRFLTLRHGDRQPSFDEIEEAVIRLSGRLPEIVKLREQPDGMLAWAMLASAVL
jgi:hypothetical protein